jgi:hypothetical protein
MKAARVVAELLEMNEPEPSELVSSIHPIRAFLKAFGAHMHTPSLKIAASQWSELSAHHGISSKKRRQLETRGAEGGDFIGRQFVEVYGRYDDAELPDEVMDVPGFGRVSVEKIVDPPERDTEGASHHWDIFAEDTGTHLNEFLPFPHKPTMEVLRHALRGVAH